MSRLLTAVNGGSISFVEHVFLPYMFGTTYPIFEIDTMRSERIGGPALADYIRGEFRPADRLRVLAALRGGPLVDRRRPRPGRRLRAWLYAVRTGRRRRAIRPRAVKAPSASAIDALEAGLLSRAFPRERFN